MNQPIKDLNFYLGLRYRTECRKLTQEEGGGFLCWIPQFGGAAGISGTGDTVEEAREHLEEVKALRFGHWLKEGQEIEEPEAASASGRILLRTSPIIHAELIDRAAREKISLNMLLNQMLAAALVTSTAHYNVEGEPKQTAQLLNLPLEDWRTVVGTTQADSEARHWNELPQAA